MIKAKDDLRATCGDVTTLHLIVFYVIYNNRYANLDLPVVRRTKPGLKELRWVVPSLLMDYYLIGYFLGVGGKQCLLIHFLRGVPHGQTRQTGGLS